MDRKRIETFALIPKKANHILFCFLVAILIISGKIWYLTVYQQESVEGKLQKLRKKVVLSSPNRGTIRDRNNIVLAANKIDYRVGVQYGPISEIPRKIYDQNGVVYLRKNYIEALSKKLSSYLHVPYMEIMDCLYTYAVFSPHTPFFLKSNLSEREYYTLNMLAKDWPGIVVQRATKRTYPLGKVASHVLGYTGSISASEYYKNVSESTLLKTYIEAIEGGEEAELPRGISSYFEAKRRLFRLERMSYGYNDQIGKSGIEASFERVLRGYCGKKYFFTNAYGNPIKEAPFSSAPVPGKRLVLTISAQLQEFCEKMLIMSEQDRTEKLQADFGRIEKGAKDPFVRGGAIVAMDPENGEILALASYPRFDPNDFVRSPPTHFKQDSSEKIARWIESDAYIKRVFDGEEPFFKEIVQNGVVKEIPEELTWDLFLKKILPMHAKEKELLHSSRTIAELLLLQKEESIASDLARLIVRKEEVSGTLFKKISGMHIGEYHSLIQIKTIAQRLLRKVCKEAYYRYRFPEWRQNEEKKFLDQKRKMEVELKKKPKVYIDYLDEEKKRQFLQFWEENEHKLLASFFGCMDPGFDPWTKTFVKSCQNYFLRTYANRFQKEIRGSIHFLAQLSKEDLSNLLSILKGFDGLTYPLKGKYSRTNYSRSFETGQDIIRSLFSLRSPPMASLSHMHPTAQGSIFKLFVAYSALEEQIKVSRENLTNFFQFTDKTWISGGKTYVGYDHTGKMIPQIYKGGRIPKSARSNNGALDLVTAIAKSSNPYFSLLASEYLSSPDRLIQTASSFGFGKKTGISLPAEASGRLPTDLKENKTGLYTTAIGQHTLLVTPLQTAVALSALANGGNVLIPRLVKMAVDSKVLSEENPFKIDPGLAAIGFTMPLWIESNAILKKQLIELPKTTVLSSLNTPKEITKVLFTGMKGALLHALDARSLGKLHLQRPDLFTIVKNVKANMIGKSSTAESFERLGLGLGQIPYMYNHTWFGGMYFDAPINQETFLESKKPSLVVVVFLRYGTYGKDAAHIAACVCHEWARIKNRL